MFSKNTLLLALVILIFATSGHSQITNSINYVSTRDMTVDVACRMLSYATGHNITPTASAAEETCSFLFRDGSIEEALDSLSVSSDLVYRKNPTHSGYQILTLEEFRENNIFTADEKIMVFQVEPSNVELIAQALEALFPNEVIYEDPEGVLDLSSSPALDGGSGLGGGSGSNSRGGARGSRNSNNRTVNNSNRGSSGRFGRDEPLPESRLSQQQAVNVASDNQEAREPAGRSIFVTVNLESNQVIVRTSNLPALQKIQELIQELDKPIKQVVLEMKILSLLVGDGDFLGVDYQATAGSDRFFEIDPQTGDPTGAFIGPNQQLQLGRFATGTAQNFFYQFLSSDFSARIQALAQNSDIEVLATPMVIAANNRESEIVAGEDRVLITNASLDSNIAGDNGTRNDLITFDTERRVIGTTLRVIPRINDDNTVALHVEQESSTLLDNGTLIPLGTDSNGIFQEIEADAVNTSTITSDLVIKSGNTIIMGGLVRTENTTTINKVPVLGDIPVLKHAFRNKEDRSQKSELILLITPRIVDPGSVGTYVTQNLTDQSHHNYFKGGEELLELPNKGLREYNSRYQTGVLPPRSNINYVPSKSVRSVKTSITTPPEFGWSPASPIIHRPNSIPKAIPTPEADPYLQEKPKNLGSDSLKRSGKQHSTHDSSRTR